MPGNCIDFTKKIGDVSGELYGRDSASLRVHAKNPLPEPVLTGLDNLGWA